MATLDERIAEIEAKLDAGARRIGVDGMQVEYDLEELRRQLARLKAEKEKTARPRAASVDLSGC